MADDALKSSIRGNLVEINNVIGEVYKTAKEMGIPPSSLRNNDGSFTLAPLLLAKSQCLLGLATLARK